MEGQISFKLEVFEGPLDLLLHLIEKNKIDICDIPIAELLEQYMEYVEEYKRQDLDSVSDFIHMASTLLYIKSRMLLPKQEDEEDPRGPLVDMLAEYQRYKAAAADLSRFSGTGENLYVRAQEEVEPDPIYKGRHDPSELQEAYESLYRRIRGKLPPPVETFRAYVSTKVVSVGSRITFVLRQLVRSGQTLFSTLFVGARSRSDIVATFLAVLELSKVNRIRLDETGDKELKITLVPGRHRDSAPAGTEGE